MCSAIQVPVPSLSERCAESLLSNRLDLSLSESERSIIDENVLTPIWGDLKTKVPENALGLQTIIADIENDPASAVNPEAKISGFFRKLAAAFYPEFQEAGIVLNHRIPCSWSEYTCVQNILEKKWSEETLLLIRSKVYVDQAIKIDLSRQSIRVCPTEINQFQSLQILDVRFNKLRSFLCDLTPCKHLKRLCLSNNEIQKFSPNLSCSSKLERLELTMNRMPSFSANLEACTKLNWIDLSFNRIEKFSSNLKNLTQLTKLNLIFNKLSAFSYDLLPDKKPKSVLLSRNLIPNPATPPGFRRTRPKLLAPPPQTEASTSPKSQRAKGPS